MDRPLQASNTSTLWSSSLVPSDGVIFINEMMTAEGGEYSQTNAPMRPDPTTGIIGNLHARFCKRRCVHCS